MPAQPMRRHGRCGVCSGSSLTTTIGFGSRLADSRRWPRRTCRPGWWTAAPRCPRAPSSTSPHAWHEARLGDTTDERPCMLPGDHRGPAVCSAFALNAPPSPPGVAAPRAAAMPHSDACSATFHLTSTTSLSIVPPSATPCRITATQGTDNTGETLIRLEEPRITAGRSGPRDRCLTSPGFWPHSLGPGRQTWMPAALQRDHAPDGKRPPLQRHTTLNGAGQIPTLCLHCRAPSGTLLPRHFKARANCVPARRRSRNPVRSPAQIRA